MKRRKVNWIKKAIKSKESIKEEITKEKEKE
jgi:hypothetical protein